MLLFMLLFSGSQRYTPSWGGGCSCELPLLVTQLWMTYVTSSTGIWALHMLPGVGQWQKWLVVVLLPRWLAILSLGLEILSAMNPSHPMREAFSFHFWDNISSVTFHLIGWFDFKALWRIPEAKHLREIMKISMENVIQKWAYVPQKHI